MPATPAQIPPPTVPILRALPRETSPEKPPHTTTKPQARYLQAVAQLPLSIDIAEPEIPEPAPGFVRALAVQGYEVLAGSRNVTQLGPLVSVGLARRMVAMRAVWNDRRIVYKDQRGGLPRASAVRIDQITPATAEASVVLHIGERVHAVALRLEWTHKHWRACELIVL